MILKTSPKGNLRMMEKILGLITQPVVVFQGLKERPDLFMPILLILLTILAGLFVSDFSQELMIKQFPQLPLTESSPHYLLSIITGSIITILLWVLKSLLHYGMAILLGGEGPFIGTLSIIGYTYFPTMVQVFLASFTLLTLGTPITLGLGLLLPVSEQYFTLKGLIFSTINIFELALIILMTSGLSVAMGISIKKSLFISLFFWIIAQIITIGFAVMSFRLMEYL